jgi:3D (Asp-Asp-Asp) domain-containing protein
MREGEPVGGLAPWIPVAGGGVVILAMCIIAVSILLSTLATGEGSSGCSSTSEATGTPKFEGSSSGSWLATAYGPPWEGIQGTGITATGIDLRPAKHAYIVAVDPTVIPLGSHVYVKPNPFNNDSIPFEAADTGEKIIGKHVDIYDWRGRTYQTEWGARKVTVTPAPSLSAASIFGATELSSDPVGCSISTTGPVPLTPGQTAKISSEGKAAAPTEIPGKAGKIVKAIIAAGNEIDNTSYLYGGGHGTLTHLYPAYDCSSSTSYLLYKAGLLGPSAETSTELESWGEPGPGKYLTIYANSGHVFLAVAGIVFNTAWYAEPPEQAIVPDPPSSGPRWQHASTIPRQFKGDEYGGFVASHWPGT